MIAMILFSFICQANKEKEQLIWLTDDSEDLVNLNSPNKQVSIGTDTTNLVLQALSEFDIDIQLVQIPRASMLMKAMDNVCLSNRVKTKARLKDNIFSLPVNIFPSLRLYYMPTQKSALEQGIDERLFTDRGELKSLASLFTVYPEAILAMTKGRSFGDIIDNQLEQVPERNKMTRAGDGRYHAIIQMLLKGRIDFIIHFPVEIRQELKDLPKQTNLSSVSLANTSEYIVGHIACSDSELGREVIAKVNAKLMQLYQDRAYYQAHRRYLPESDLNNFARYYKEVFGTEVPKRTLTPMK
ncbi:hypothetical protein [Litorilituus lipolyticus]|uniref:hypothetical protein n=1 Tax=Litorilituus lipolyticus TaxID=2491017 RepID=UPI00112CF56B|nr:hypothetical protein [Litorilituus lipolyticus]